MNLVRFTDKHFRYAVIGCGAAALVYITLTQPITFNFANFLFLVLMATLAESQPVITDQEKTISVGFAIDLCALLLYGPLAAAWVVFLSSVFSVTHVKSWGYLHMFNTPVDYLLFNAMNLTLSIIACGFVYQRMGGPVLAYLTMNSTISLTTILGMLSSHVFSIIFGIMAHIMVNTSVISIHISIATDQKALMAWAYSFLWSIFNLLTVGLMGVMIAALYTSYGALVVILFMVPLLMARNFFVQYVKMRDIYLNTIMALTSAIEAKDVYTKGHSERVQRFSLMIARELHLSGSQLEMLRYAAILHDIGKIGISESILNKPTKLEKSEFEKIMEHPLIGSKIVEEIDFLNKASKIIRSHHEFYDGSGYPDGLKGEAIMLESQILAVADAYDAMTTTRPYREAFTEKGAWDELVKGSGKQFSPEVVKAFRRAIDKKQEISDAF
ncbi:MAG: Cyclic di-GMP phosphodiesterase response regulator RpfG [Firmicutes bacterium ADurb.Bin153]|nr:MAG: Cyclic di-GMP phosphodiesterase response regulator RpfG [Firmicutes bacterium ADurb.Bin153]